MTDNNRQLSENAGSGSKNPTSQRSLDVEREPMPDRAPDTASDKAGIPPVRSGNVSKTDEKPTKGDPVTNPTHHTGHIPPPVTANRD
ncbi:hypothetical protein OCK02_20560 [Rhizobium sp. TRM96647]|jgi:hypothetical protein|uniref:hypothetical protein n=1 Tax=unclassified Rhizobium TaxID=2613769 RepID=UPI0021E7D68C|nr:MULTISPECIES: hypothetical protein [unclassified Rhizobium]MCV3738604.1 hypothetical protein [Rhizobium sp. TRM96647]MCV3760291.1 hypothetical protein [Rhizobium sp. TRM96650]